MKDLDDNFQEKPSQTPPFPSTPSKTTLKKTAKGTEIKILTPKQMLRRLNEHLHRQKQEIHLKNYKMKSVKSCIPCFEQNESLKVI